MDPVSIVAGSSQIAIHCVQCLVGITKWINLVKNVDADLMALKNEVGHLQENYKRLSVQLKSPSRLEAAREADQNTGGGLWKHIKATLNDCEETLRAINKALNDIDTIPRRLRALRSPVLRQLKLSLASGNLSRLQARLPVFNATLTSSMQMISITLHLQQKETTVANHKELLDAISDLRKSIQDIRTVARPLTTSNSREPNQDDSPAADLAFYNNIQKYAGAAQTFLSTASTTATERSGTTVHGQPMTVGGEIKINDWIDTTEQDRQASEQQPMETAVYDETDLILTQEFLRNGQSAMTKNEFVIAAGNFKEALAMLDQNQFGEQLGYSRIEIQLFLAQCFLKQEANDEAIKQLLPLVEERSDCSNANESEAEQSTCMIVEEGLKFSACHVLACAYLQKKSLTEAERYANQAFRGRKRLLKLSSSKTIDSLELLIEVYESSGSNIRAQAHHHFLPPQSKEANATDPAQSNAGSEPAAEATESVEENPTQARILEASHKQRFKYRFWRGNGSASKRSEDFGGLSDPPGRHCDIDDDESLKSPDKTASRVESLRKVKSENQHAGGKKTAIEHKSPILRSRTYPVVRLPSIVSNSNVIIDAQVPSSVDDLMPIFEAIRSFCENGDMDTAVKTAFSLFERYDRQHRILKERRKALEANIRRGGKSGLAATGHGYAAIHFFCEIEMEAIHEIEILLRDNVDINSVAYRPGYGDADPFTPLEKAIAKGHVAVVQLLLDADVSINPIHLVTKIAMRQEIIHPLLLAHRVRDTQIVSMLLERDAYLSPKNFSYIKSFHGNSLLHHSCWEGDSSMIESLLEYLMYHPDVKAETLETIGTLQQQDKWGMTPFMYVLDTRDLRPNEALLKSSGMPTLLESMLHHALDLEELGRFLPIADVLKLKATGGEHKGHSAICLAQKSNNEGLMKQLEPYVCDFSADDHCDAVNRCDFRVKPCAVQAPVVETLEMYKGDC